MCIFVAGFGRYNMNPIEVYKKLPKKNCGECPQKTCMAYALALIKGDATVEECPHTDEALRKDLSEYRGKDWRDSLIDTLRKDIKDLDFNTVLSRSGGLDQNGKIMIKCLGTDYFIDRNGEITTPGHINPWIKILLLHYIKTGGVGEPTGEWVSFSELKSGMVKETSFRRDCEEPLRQLLDNNLEEITVMIRRLGGREISHPSADHAWELYALPRVPVLILYRMEDEELNEYGESHVRILFDRSADRFLDVESLVFLLEGFIHIISRR